MLFRFFSLLKESQSSIPLLHTVLAINAYVVLGGSLSVKEGFSQEFVREILLDELIRCFFHRTPVIDFKSFKKIIEVVHKQL